MGTVLVVDDQAMVRAGLVLLLQRDPSLTVAGEAGDGVRAVTLARQVRPDCVLMDVRMPTMDGVEATRLLTEVDPAMRVLVLTTFDEDDLVIDALRAGAAGFLLKQAAPQDLLAAVHAVLRGGAWIDPAVAPGVLARVRAVTSASPRNAIAALTARENEILVMMAQGSSNSDIARSLFLSEATVKTHVSRILMKTGSRDRTQAVVLAFESGLVRAGARGRGS